MRKRIFLSLILIFVSMPVFAAESDTYDFSWLDTDKEVYVLQNRKFRKNKRLFLNLGMGTTISGSFVDSNNLQGRIGYFFKEDWGVTIIYSRNDGSENNAAKSVRSVRGVPFRRITQDYQAVLANWSPFYTKINVFNKIIYADWILGLGLARLNEENNREELNTAGATGADVIKSETHTGGVWDLGVKIYLTKNFSADVNITSIIYSAEKAVANTTAKRNYTNTDLTVSVGFMF